MAIVLDSTNVKQAHVAPGSTSLTIGSWVVPSGSDAVLIVGSGSVQDTTNVTHGGSAITFKDSSEVSYLNVELWYKLAPSGTADIVISIAAGAQIQAFAAGYTGVNQTTPFGTVAKANGSSTTPSVDVSSATGELVIDVVTSDDPGTSITPGTNQTLVKDGLSDAGGGYPNTSSAYEAGAVSVTMSWTNQASGQWEILGVPLKPVAGSSASPSISPSASPSLSPSASISPSVSPSISPSISPSVSPSLSPSASISPSISPSVSPVIVSDESIVELAREMVLDGSYYKLDGSNNKVVATQDEARQAGVDKAFLESEQLRKLTELKKSLQDIERNALLPTEFRTFATKYLAFLG